MNTKHGIRKCIGCSELKDKSQLIRITRLHDTGEIVIEPTSKHFGRSSYLCYNKECLRNAIKKKRLQKTLKKEISASTLEHLERIIDKYCLDKDN